MGGLTGGASPLSSVGSLTGTATGLLGSLTGGSSPLGAVTGLLGPTGTSIE